MLRKNRIFCVVVYLFVAAGIFQNQGHGSPVFGIQVGSFPTRQPAEELQTRLQSTTCSVVLREDPKAVNLPFKVALGPFQSYMDAWAANNALPEGFPTSRFVVNWEVSDENREITKSEQQDRGFQLAPSFAGGGSTSRYAPDPAGLVQVSIPTLVAENPETVKPGQLQTLSKDQLLSVGFRGKMNSQAAEALQVFLANNPADPLAPAVKLRLSRRLMGQKKFDQAKVLLASVAESGSAEEKQKARLIAAYVELSTKGAKPAYAAFLSLAADENLSREVRSHAMRMVAGNAHAAKEYTSAVLAYRQIQDEAPSLPERHEASVQLCGLQFELVGRGKGTWDEVIVSCDALFHDPEVSRELKATADLMRFEAMFHAGYIDEAIATCESFLKTYPDIRREYISASTWYGALLVHADRRDEAVEVLKPVLDMDIGAKDKFGAHEPKARAAYWLAFIEMQRGDMTARDYYVNYIKTNFPKSMEASKLSALTADQSTPSR